MCYNIYDVYILLLCALSSVEASACSDSDCDRCLTEGFCFECSDGKYPIDGKCTGTSLFGEFERFTHALMPKYKYCITNWKYLKSYSNADSERPHFYSNVMLGSLRRVW